MPTPPFPFQQYVYYNSPYTIGDTRNEPLCIGDGIGKIEFTGPLGEPILFPEMIPDINVTVKYMRQGYDQPGNRVFKARGGNVGYRDVEFKSIVTPTQLAQLYTWFEEDPGGSSYNGFAYSPDGGTTNYDALWKKGGLVPVNIELNQRLFTAVTIKLYILGAAISMNLAAVAIIT